VAERLDRDLERAGQRGAEEGVADALDAGVGLHLERDDLARRAGSRRTVRQRLVRGNAGGFHLDFSGLHGVRLVGTWWVKWVRGSGHFSSSAFRSTTGGGT